MENLDEWSALPFRGNYKSVITDDVGEYAGDYDAHYEFNVMYDDEYLYLGMAVWDDELVHKQEWIILGPGCRIDKPGCPAFPCQCKRKGTNRFKDYFILILPRLLQEGYSGYISGRKTA